MNPNLLNELMDTNPLQDKDVRFQKDSKFSPSDLNPFNPYNVHQEVV